MRLFTQQDSAGFREVYADTWPDKTGLSTALLGAVNPSIAETTIRLRVANGGATYRVTGVDASGHILLVERLDSTWTEPEGPARLTWTILTQGDAHA